VWKGADAREIKGKDWKNSGRKYRVSNSREEGEQPSLSITEEQRQKASSVVVSARGWLVVNPFGIAEPTVGWK
jgi:hypothetical protein